MAYFNKRYHSPGMVPGTLVTHEATTAHPLIIGLIDYDSVHLTKKVNVSAEDTA